MGSFRGDACAVATLLVCLTTSCGRCSDEPRVPFKLPRAGDEGADAAVVATVDASAQPSHAFAPVVDRPQIEGRALGVTHVHAVLESDLDHDGDRDALVLSEDDQQQPRLHAASREPTGFAAPVAITQFTQAPAPGCGTASAQLVPLSESKAVAALERACSAEAAAGAPRASLWLLSLEGTPRVHERIDLPAPAPGAAALRAQPRSLDADGDGHDDVALELTLDGAPPSSQPVKLVWLDRPSGLVRDAREPDATLASWAREAQALAAKEPARAIALAELGVTLARALCRELGAPVIRVAGAAGVACGAMKSSSALMSTLVAAHAKRGALAPAFDAYRTLRDIEPMPDERTLGQAASALSQLKATPGIVMRRVSAVDTVRVPRIHLPSARFLSDTALYVRRAPPVLIDLDANAESVAPVAADSLMRDPSGRLIATVIERSCEGHAVRIERAPPPGSDYVSSPAVALASLSSAIPASSCPRGGARVDDGGFTLLGWAPQGLLAARGSELTLVPLASDGRPLGAPRILAPDAPRPAPLPAGVATADASRYVEATPAGVLVYGSGAPALWRPDGYAAIAKGPLEAAISPTGRRVALVAGGSVYVLEQP